MNIYDKIRQWAHDRNLIEGSTVARQFKKLMEEFGELGCAIMENNEADIKDAIGDCAVVLTIIAAMKHYNIEQHADEWCQRDISFIAAVDASGYIVGDENESFDFEDVMHDAIDYLQGYAVGLGYDFDECLALAYNEIKDRKGRMIDGVFVKDE